jgi:SAM-dependent methyltransferase
MVRDVANSWIWLRGSDLCDGQSPRRKNKTMKCLRWDYSPTAATEFLRVVGDFRASPLLTDWAEDYARQHAGRLAFDARYLADHYLFSNCLNIGGAPFLFEYLLKQARPEVEIVSADLAPERFPDAARVLGVRTVQLDIEDGSLDALKLGRFDCVVFAEIFEHLRHDLLGTVASLRSLLSDDGILYLTTPNGIGLYGVWEKAHGRTGSDPVDQWSKLTKLGHMGHVREYSAREVRRVLTACGFDVVEQFYRRASRRTSVRSTVASSVRGCATTILPFLGDELVFVVRRAAGA